VHLNHRFSYSVRSAFTGLASAAIGIEKPGHFPEFGKSSFSSAPGGGCHGRVYFLTVDGKMVGYPINAVGMTMITVVT